MLHNKKILKPPGSKKRKGKCRAGLTTGHQLYYQADLLDLSSQYRKPQILLKVSTQWTGKNFKKRIRK